MSDDYPVVEVIALDGKRRMVPAEVVIVDVFALGEHRGEAISELVPIDRDRYVQLQNGDWLEI